MNSAEEQLKELDRQISQQYEYETKSLDELAVSLALGAELVDAHKRGADDRFLTFVLKADFDMKKIALQLASKTLQINAFSLCEAIRRAKSVIHNR